MNPSFSLSLWCLVTLISTAVIHAEPPASSDTIVMAFTIPPFAEEGTVAGIEDWEMISSGLGKPELALVRSFKDSQTGLLLKTYGIQRLLPNRQEGRVTMTTVVQFGMVSDKGTPSNFTFMPIVGVGVGAAPFGFDNSDASNPESGGFFYTEKILDENDQVIQKHVHLLPREAAYEGAKYTLVLDMDLDERTYVLTITGKDASGQPIKVQSEKISMEAPGRSSAGNQFLTGIRLASSMPANTEFFVESITFAPTAP